MSTLEYKLTYLRHLPHIQPPGATLFVTFRLAGSIPADVQQALLAEMEQVEKALAQITDTSERARQAYREGKRLFGKWDKALDQADSGPLWLQEPEVAQLMAESLHYRHGRVYDLDTFCIMSNHVHVIFTPLEEANGKYHALSAIMQSLKGYTAYEANLRLKRLGQFWQHESYDHIIRSLEEWQRICNYVLNNPVRAGLVKQWHEWPWTYCKHYPQDSLNSNMPA
jgi:REP element-mobilizing transposase RayT